jgi:membrane protease YdiL (CAAX protease family)
MQSQVFDRGKILSITLLLEAGLLFAAACWIQLAQLNIMPQFLLTRKVLIIGALGGLATAMSGFVIVFLGRIFGNSIKWISALRRIVYDEVAPLFKDLNFGDILLISVSSGFCEESFFRGVMQTEIGLVPTSLFFGLVHCPAPRYLSYGLWAVAAGLFLGFLRDQSGSVWAPIFAHGLSNLIVITYLRYFAKLDPPQEKHES